MKDWKQILYDIYTPDIGSILTTSNGIWTNSFAANKPDTEYHPAIVGKVSSCKTRCNIVPGTTKNYKMGSCVYKVTLNLIEPNYPLSYFLINLWMTYNSADVSKFKQGWGGINKLNDEQLIDFKLQVKYCTGINV